MLIAALDWCFCRNERGVVDIFEKSRSLEITWCSTTDFK